MLELTAVAVVSNRSRSACGAPLDSTSARASTKYCSAASSLRIRQPRCAPALSISVAINAAKSRCGCTSLEML